METVLNLKELQGVILLQSDPASILKLAQTNQSFREVLNSSAKNLGLKLGWSIENFDDFLDVYYTTYFTEECVNYFSPNECLYCAVREGNLKSADKYFEYIRFQGIMTLGIAIDVGKIAGERLILEDDQNIYNWAVKKVRPYSYMSGIDSIDVIAKSGNSEKLKAALLKNEGQSSVLNLYSAIGSGNVKTIETLLKYSSIDLLKDLSWTRAYTAAIKSGNIEAVKYIKQLGIENGIDWDDALAGLDYTDYIILTQNLNLLREWLQLSIPKIDVKSRYVYNIENFFHKLSERNNRYKTLETASILIDLIPFTFNQNPTFYVVNILLPIIGKGNLNLFYYCMRRFELSSQVIDRVYLWIYNFGPFSQFKERYSLDVFLSLNEDEVSTKLYEMRSSLKSDNSLGFTYFLDDAIQRDVPDHPGILKAFRKLGDNKKIYSLDFLDACVSNNENLVDKLITTYRIDQDLNKALIESCKAGAWYSVQGLSAYPSVNLATRNNEPLRIIINEILSIPLTIRCTEEYKKNNDQISILDQLLNDPRVNVGIDGNKILKIFDDRCNEGPFSKDSYLFESIASDSRIYIDLTEKISTIMNVHRMFHLSYKARYKIMMSKKLKNDKKRNLINEELYLSSDEKIANILNRLHVPWIPHLNHLAAALLPEMFKASEYKTYIDKWNVGIVPYSTLLYIDRVRYYMTEKETYEPFIEWADS